jgi:hypothetical protein
MPKINPRKLLIISALLSLVDVILTLSGTSGNWISQLPFVQTIGYIIAFPFYILYFLAVHNSHDSYGAGLGAGILITLAGPILVFVAWFIVLYALEYIYLRLTKKNSVAPKESTDNKKETRRTWITLGICTAFVIILDIFLIYIIA